MFPWVYEFRWTPYHLIFLGIFFSVIAVIFTTVGLALWRVTRNFAFSKAEAIQWKAEFEELPGAARVCRHELTGEVPSRTCHHDFDCRTCATHPVFLAQYDPEQVNTPLSPVVYGFNMPSDRMYHRGHTWMKKESDGTCTIGLDDFGTKLIGTPDAVDLPEVGARIQANGTAWHLRKGAAKLRILAPIDGQVVERGGPDQDWYLKVRSADPEHNTRHLLRGAEIRPWILREMERLQMSFPMENVGPTLADGGELAPDIWKQYPKVDWEGVWGEMFLEA
jgi:glycine cleavage system H lipoate-binding protein